MLKFLTWVAIIIVLYATVAHTDFSQTEEEAISTLEAMHATFGIPLLLLIHRVLLNWHVKRQMFSNASAEPEPETRSRPIEKPAERMPRIVELDAESVPEAVREYREQLVHELSARARRSLWTSLAACVAYVGVPWGFAWLAGQPVDKAVWEPYGGWLLIYFIIVVARYRLTMSDLRPEGQDLGFSLVDLHPARWVFMALEGAFRALSSPRADLLLVIASGGVLVAMTNPASNLALEDGAFASAPLPFFVGVCLVFALYLGLTAVRYRMPKPNPNVRLLVLRVFGRAKAARFTFDRVVRFWKSFGPHFTVDDPSLAKYRNRFFQLRTLLQFLFLYALSAVNVLSGLAVLAILMAHDWLEGRQRAPVKNQAQVLDRLRPVIYRPQFANGTYRSLEMICHMDTWKMVVTEYVRHTHVVLMDLREYSSERAGSQYEVNFIFDHVPVDRIVFLRDENTDTEAVHGLIMDMWRELRVGSPNEHLENPVINVFIAGKQGAEDVQALLDLLLSAGRGAAEDKTRGESERRRLLPESLTEPASYRPES